MAGTRSGLLMAVVAAGTLAAGCGSSSAPTTPDPAAVSVIREWSNALRSGDVHAAARYFALPSRFVNGPDSSGAVPVIVIHTQVEAEAVNATLSCGARLISADQRGRYVNALFRLTDRPGPGGGCGSGAGQVARTDFVIVQGRIAEWIRAPADPGEDPGGGSGPGPAAPSAPQTGAPVI